MGIRDYFSDVSICLMEWPERGKGVLPEQDVLIDVSVAGVGRRICITANATLTFA